MYRTEADPLQSRTWSPGTRTWCSTACWAVYPFLKSGRLKALAVSAPKRVAAVPDLPTVAEAGLPGFETGSWQGVLAPAGTPREIVDKLNAADHPHPEHSRS